MGEIYESRHQIEKAKSSYQKCLSLKYSEYKAGISMKARSRLNILEKTKQWFVLVFIFQVGLDD